MIDNAEEHRDMGKKRHHDRTSCESRGRSKRYTGRHRALSAARRSLSRRICRHAAPIIARTVLQVVLWWFVHDIGHHSAGQ